MTFKVALKDIVHTGDRGRKTFTRILELAESIRQYGIIHPIVVARAPGKEGKYILVAGERRYRGAIVAGCDFIEASLREDSADVLAEIELEENVCRVNISFEEEGITLAKIQKLKKAADPKWGLAETAQMTNRSVGDVSQKIKIAKIFKARPDLKKACERLPYTAAIKKIEQIEEAEKVQRLSDQGLIQLTTDLLHGDCLNLIGTLDTASVDMMLTDPPYGIPAMEVLKKSALSTLPGHSLMGEHHNLSTERILEILTALAPELNRVLKPAAHFYMFCGFQYIGEFIHALAPHLEFQPPIIIWDRGKPSMPAYGYSYMSRAECIIYGCRPPRGRRLNKNVYNIIECPDVPKGLRMFPSEKPLPLLQTLISNSSIPNDVVLDPFAGSASTLVAARTSGRRAIGFEIDKDSYLRAQKRLTAEESP